MIKSFSGQAVFCFAILRAISAYVGENWLSQYICRLVCVDALRFHPILIKCGEDNWIAAKLLFFGSIFLEG